MTTVWDRVLAAQEAQSQAMAAAMRLTFEALEKPRRVPTCIECGTSPCRCGIDECENCGEDTALSELTDNEHRWRIWQRICDGCADARESKEESRAD